VIPTATTIVSAANVFPSSGTAHRWGRSPPTFQLSRALTRRAGMYDIHG
jgi:hypothetical protein